MKVLWLCNIMLPFIAQNLGQKTVVKEGWLSGLVEKLIANSEDMGIELSICFPTSDYVAIAEQSDALYIKGKARGVDYYVFREDTVHPENYDVKLEESLGAIVEEAKPDIVHIFGTEYPHTLAMCKAFPYPEKILVGIQGVLCAYAEVYMANLPVRVQNKKTFRDYLKQDGLHEQQDKFFRRADNEKEALKLVGNVTGRTDFDKEWTGKLAPNAKYHFMNETLRETFYNDRWNINQIEEYSIFVSQGNYPIKGLHEVLPVFEEIVKEFPEAKLYVAGDIITANDTIKDKVKISGYGKYLLSLIRKYKLESHVKFLGALSADQMCARYLKTHVFLCPSVIENSPNSVGEAMILGVPTVSADVGGIHNLLVDGKEGLLYKYGDKDAMKKAITDIFKDDKLALSLSGQASVHARATHDPNVNYKRLVEIYHDIYDSI